MKTKSFILSLILVVCSESLWGGDSLYEYAVIDGISYRLGFNATVWNNVKYSGSVKIPSSVTYNDKTYDVTSIGKSAFSNCSSLESVSIPSSITSIETDAFKNCTNLTAVYIYDLSAWCKISINGMYANPLFYARKLYLQGKRVMKLVIPDDVTNIGGSVFAGCQLTSLTIPNSVKSIGNNAFYGCTPLAAIEIPNSVTSLGSSVFESCTYLSSVTIPNSVKSIGPRAFAGCKKLLTFEIPNSITTISYSTFESCTGLTSVTIPNSVQIIGDDAFSGCSVLTSIIIPNSVTKIGRKAFYNCSGLTSIIVENSNSKFDSRNNCNAIIETASNTLLFGCKKTITPNSITSIGDFAFSCLTDLKSIEIPKGVTEIGNRAFDGCTGLTSVTIPNSITSIGCGAFSGCTNLSIVYISDLSAWCNVNFCGLEANPVYYACNLCVQTDVVSDLIIPNGVTKIADFAFSGCHLRSITIPRSVYVVGRAFYKCYWNHGSYIVPVTCLNKVPPTLWDGGDTFSSLDLFNSPLYVPKESVTDYRLTQWGVFREIIGIDAPEEAVELVQEQTSKSSKVFLDGQILILRGNRTYTLTGQEVK